MGQPIGGGTDTANPLVTGSFAATGQSTPTVFYSAFNVSIWGTFVGTIDLERSFDGGTTWIVCSIDSSGTPSSYSAPISLVATEPEHQVLYRLNCTAYTSGTANYRLSQASDFQFIGGLGR